MVITLIILLQFFLNNIYIYIDIKLNLSYYASIVLDAFKHILCSKLCWHNRPGPSTHTTDDYAQMEDNNDDDGTCS